MKHKRCNPYFALFKRDLLLAVRHGREWLNPVLFFILIISLFPLGISPEPHVLKMLAPGIIWVAALLATLLSLDNVFRNDYEDGSLEQLLVSPYSTGLFMLAKTLVHWLITGLPLILTTPLLAVLLALPADASWTLTLTLLLGTPTLSLIGAIGAALTVGLKRSGMLLSLVVLPLYIPVLIFAASAVDATASGLPSTGQLYYLAALLVLTLSVAPAAIAAALKISIAN